MPTPEEQGLIWITEAMVKYRHSRNWFNNRIRDGIFEQVPVLRTTKVYLRDAEVAEYIRNHPEEADERSSKSNPVAAA